MDLIDGFLRTCKSYFYDKNDKHRAQLRNVDLGREMKPLGASVGLLGATWRRLGRAWGGLGAVLGRSWGRLVAVLKRPGAFLGPNTSIFIGFYTCFVKITFLKKITVGRVS